MRQQLNKSPVQLASNENLQNKVDVEQESEPVQKLTDKPTTVQ